MDTRDIPESTLPHQVLLAGKIQASVNLADIIGFIHQNKWKGHLRVTDYSGVRVLSFHDGDLRLANSTRPQDRLGEILYRYGKITQEQLSLVLGKMMANDRIGTVLVRENLISAHDLFTHIRLQASEIFFDVLCLEGGMFEFIGDSETASIIDLGLSTQELLLNAMRTIDEIDRCRERIPSGACVPRRTRVSTLTALQDDEREILTLVNGERTVSDIGRKAQIGEVAATLILYRLIGARHVELLSESEMRDARIQKATGQSVQHTVQIFARIFEQVHLLTTNGGGELSLGAAMSSFALSGNPYAYLFQNVEIQDGYVFPVEAFLGNLQQVADEEALNQLRGGMTEFLRFLSFTLADRIGSIGQIWLHHALEDTQEPSTQSQPHRNVVSLGNVTVDGIPMPALCVGLSPLAAEIVA